MLEHCLERNNEDYDRASEVAFGLITRIFNIQITENESVEEAKKRNGGLIVLTRHPGDKITRYVDILVAGYFLKHALDKRGYFVGKASVSDYFKKMQSFARIIGVDNLDNLGLIPVYRTQDAHNMSKKERMEANAKAYRAVAEVYDLGERVVLFPEGRSTSGKAFDPKKSNLNNVNAINTSEDPWYLPLNIQYTGLRSIILTAGPLIQTRSTEILDSHLRKYITDHPPSNI